MSTFHKWVGPNELSLFPPYSFIWAYSFMKFALNNHPTLLLGPTCLFGTWEYVSTFSSLMYFDYRYLIRWFFFTFCLSFWHFPPTFFLHILFTTSEVFFLLVTLSGEVVANFYFCKPTSILEKLSIALRWFQIMIPSFLQIFLFLLRTLLPFCLK